MTVRAPAFLSAILAFGCFASDGLFASQPAEDALSPKAEAAIQQLSAQDEYERLKAFIRLEALREPASLGAVEAYLRHDDPEMRAAAARAVAAIGGLPSVPRLLEMIRRDRHALVRRAALQGLEPFAPQDPRIPPVFVEALRDRNTDVRMAAIDAVSRLGTAEAAQALRERQRREQHPDVRSVLRTAMTRIEGEDGGP